MKPQPAVSPSPQSLPVSDARLQFCKDKVIEQEGLHCLVSPGVLCSNPLKVGLELSSIVRHSFSLQRTGRLWSYWELAISEGDGFKQLLVLQLGIGHSDGVLGTD